MWGACIGDIIGSVHEFTRRKEFDFPLFVAESTFTDDTVCTIAIAECLLEGTDPAVALRRWAQRYPHPMGGYGGRFAQWLRDPAMGPYGSFGNGSAMRASPAAWLAASLEDALALARRVSAVSHNHPEGLKGAEATVCAIWLARQGEPASAIRRRVAADFGYDLSASVAEIRPTYQYNETCQQTVPQAIACALESASFEEAIRNAVSLGGDADTLAAIAGPIAEVLHGIPEGIRREGEQRLPEDLRAVLARLYE